MWVWACGCGRVGVCVGARACARARVCGWVGVGVTPERGGPVHLHPPPAPPPHGPPVQPEPRHAPPARRPLGRPPQPGRRRRRRREVDGLAGGGEEADRPVAARRCAAGRPAGAGSITRRHARATARGSRAGGRADACRLPTIFFYPLTRPFSSSSSIIFSLSLSLARSLARAQSRSLA